jgi:hypothetical protein
VQQGVVVVNNDVESVWNNNEHLSNDHKALILIAIEGTTDKFLP